MSEGAIRFAFRFQGGRAIVIVREGDADGRLHAFQHIPGLDEFDLGAIPDGSRMHDGPPTWNPFVEVVPESELRARGVA
jgi:hypothetical protein